MKKRLLTGILASVFVLSTLAGCGGTQNNTTNSGNDAATDDAAADSNTASGDIGSITMILSLRTEFLSTMESGSKKIAEEMGIDLITADAQSDTSKMIQFIETARNDGQKAVIVNLIDPETAEQCVEAAGDMKVVFVNNPPSDTDAVLNENVVYVGSDEHYSGKFQGEWLAEYFKAEGKTDIKYILVSGTFGNVSTTLRTESVIQALEDNGINATEATAPLAGDYDLSTAQDKITPLLNTIEYDCIIANNDAMALGVIEALKAEGIDPTTVPVVGIDATEDGRAAIKDGEMGMTVFQDAYGQGRGALVAAKNLIEGNPLDEGSDYAVDETGYILWVPFEPVTIDNVDEYENK